MIKSNPKTSKSRLGLNNIHYYVVYWIATHTNGRATCNSFIEGPRLNVDNFVSQKAKQNPELKDIVITSYIKLNKYEYLKLIQ